MYISLWLVGVEEVERAVERGARDARVNRVAVIDLRQGSAVEKTRIQQIGRLDGGRRREKNDETRVQQAVGRVEGVDPSPSPSVVGRGDVGRVEGVDIHRRSDAGEA